MFDFARPVISHQKTSSSSQPKCQNRWAYIVLALLKMCPFYQCIADHFEELVLAYDERYEHRVGFWRLFIAEVIEKFLECGDLTHGFARIRCDHCGRELLLELSCEKSRLIEFGEMAFIKSERNGKKPSTFDFLGFSHYMTRGRKGGLKLGRKTIGKRMRRKLVALNKEIKRLRNTLPFRKLYRHLCQILKGYYNYFGFAGNFSTLRKFEYAIRRMWFKWLNRRSQRKSFKWKEFVALLTRYPLPEPRILKGYSWIYSATL